MKSKTNETIKPQQAIEEYFLEMLGTAFNAAEENPLPALAVPAETQQRSSSPRQLAAELNDYLSASGSVQSSRDAATKPTAPQPPRALPLRHRDVSVQRQTALELREKPLLRPTLLTTLKVQPVAPETPVNDEPQTEEPTAAPELSSDIDVAVEALAPAETLPPVVKKPTATPLESQEAVIADTTALRQPQTDAEATAVTTSGLASDTPDAWLPNGRPQWAQERFECLLFSVAGLKLAVPLVCLGGIHAVDAELTPLFGMPQWFLGLMPVNDGNLRVIDTARWVMPERGIHDYAERMKYVIRLGDSDWGIACDLVDKSFSLDPADVRWRTERSKRPWLAGTVVEHMCALLDVAALDRLLQQSARQKLA